VRWRVIGNQFPICNSDPNCAMLLLRNGVGGETMQTRDFGVMRRQDGVCHGGLDYAGNVLIVG
jgi:hypothetical protein